MELDLGQFKKKKKEPEVKTEEKVISLSNNNIEKKAKKSKSFLESRPKLDIDDVSFYYRQFTGKKRSHTRGAKTTKNYMINEIVKVLNESKIK